MTWKKGRGKLGIFQPLIGKWITNKGSKDFNHPECHRTFSKVLHNSFINLEAIWFLESKTYLDHTLVGLNENKEITFWSFTSDGKQSKGILCDVRDLHPEAIGFEAKMPSGIARQAYWPDDEGGFYWTVESRTKKGWNRFVLQQYSMLE